MVVVRPTVWIFGMEAVIEEMDAKLVSEQDRRNGMRRDWNGMAGAKMGSIARSALRRSLRNVAPTHLLRLQVLV